MPTPLGAGKRSIFARGTPGTLWNMLIINMFYFLRIKYVMITSGLPADRSVTRFLLIRPPAGLKPMLLI